MANPDAAVITAIIMVFAILLGARLFVWWLDRKDRAEDDIIYTPYYEKADEEDDLE